jgi:hypothetical protein
MGQSVPTRQHPRAIRLLYEVAATAILQAYLEHPAARGGADRSDYLLDPTMLDLDRYFAPTKQHRAGNLLAPPACVATHIDRLRHAPDSSSSPRVGIESITSPYPTRVPRLTPPFQQRGIAHALGSA